MAEIEDAWLWFAVGGAVAVGGAAVFVIKRKK
jgi:LPXTG-motif cell wall-anchored protein